ncbi:transporter substrate-binding domain-containing diguanylate cyclase [Pseudoflavonifractor phocaeensis]|uniref:transporter substrate-binding domain-containing diguanylate cyclase n=1 Tax=Pseudoflavonifractor phocaeensis TaxID=1870988 RepID=UPI002108C947|nr:transporter substrate-binding domain-containing protein [Pseudoflavonifractor phocaeensis]
MERNARGLARMMAAALTLLLCVALAPPGRAAAGGSGETLRVGFPIQAGLTEADGKGNLSGYTYEYLQEIAQYTGWEYEFVQMDGSLNDVLSEMLEMLERGELDLLGAMNYSDALAEIYDYPGYSYGTSYSVLAVLDESEITESNYAIGRVLRVAVTERAAARNEQLSRFCESSQVSVEYILCKNDREQLEKLRSGEADAVLWSDLALEDDMRQIVRFSPNPFYFATTKGNNQLTARLSSAIAEISKADPYFEVELYEKYFGHKDDSLRLGGEERTYIRGVDTLRVAVMEGKAPIQDVDPATGEFVGVAREVFDYISAQTGLQFQYVTAHSSDELMQLMKEGTVDIAACVPYDYESAEYYGVALGRPYLEAQIVMVLGRGVDTANLAGKRLALSKGLIYHGGYIEDVIWYDSVRECIDAVDSGRADYAYGNGYTVQYYANNDQYRNISLVPQSGTTQELCIGVSKPVDMTLLTILNKAVLSLPNDELQAMVYRNAVPEEPVTLDAFIKSNPWVVAAAVAALALAIAGALALHYRSRMRLVRQAELENRRYTELCELLDEHLFEYDYRKDRLTLAAKSARLLGVPMVQEHFGFRIGQDEGGKGTVGRELFQLLQSGGEKGRDMQLSLPDGSRCWFRVTAKQLHDQGGRPLVTIGKLTNIQREKEERAMLVEQAQRDSLTCLYNSATIRSMAAEAMDGGDGRGALLIIDIDHFKSVNDQYGHFTGDRVLSGLSGVLGGVFRHEDLLGRLGGDEFAVFMTSVKERTVVEDKCRLILKQAQALETGEAGLRVSVSIGAALAGGGESFGQLYQRADRALYEAKKQGRNGFRVDE